MSLPSVSRDPDELAQLRAEVAALRGEMRGRQARRTPRLPRRLRGRFLPFTLVVLLVALMPLATFAAGFTDLNGGSPHNDNINAIAAVGITRGCNPPDYTQYCPNDKVTREEMASFLARTAGLGTNPPVANAKTAQTADTATNATQLNGQPASFYQPAGQPIANATHANTADTATKVGGYAPNELVRANGASYTGLAFPLSSATYTPIVSVDITAPTAGFVLINATTSMFNNDPSGASFFRVSDGTTPAPYQEVYVGTGAGYQNEATVSTTYLFPVTAGAKNFRLEGRSILGTINAFKGEITALFIPFGATGGVATGLALPEAQPESDTPQNRR